MARKKADDIDDDRNWNGGFYELALHIGANNDQRLERALQVLWAKAKIQGCFTTSKTSSTRSVELSLASLNEYQHLKGTVRLPNRETVVCGCFASRLEEEQEDWLVFYIPQASLSRVELRTGSFPFDEDGDERSLGWRGPLDAWFAAIGTDMFEDIDFQAALIGFEVWGEFELEQLKAMPDDRRPAGYLIPEGDTMHYQKAAR